MNTSVLYPCRKCVEWFGDYAASFCSHGRVVEAPKLEPIPQFKCERCRKARAIPPDRLCDRCVFDRIAFWIGVVVIWGAVAGIALAHLLGPR